MMEQCRLSSVCENPCPELRDDIDDFEYLQRHVLHADEQDAVTSHSLVISADGEVALRAVHSAYILRCFGHVFSHDGQPTTERAADELYELSQAVGSVQHFVSHSWSAGCRSKWAAMADFYNRSFGVLMGNSWWVLASATAVIWRLQTRQPIDFMAAFAIFTGAPGVITCICSAFGQHLFSSLGSLVFVDRVCIHQWDHELKLQGIRGIGDVVSNSNQLMVLWSEDYFHRLWCIFEIAAFNNASKMQLLPLWMAPFLYGVLLCNLGVHLLGALLQGEVYLWLVAQWGLPWGVGLFWALSYSLPGCFTCYIVRKCVMEKLDMEHWVAHFTLDATQVSLEEDRVFIYQEIERVFGSATEFENFVRKDVLMLLHEVVGSSWVIPYSWGAFVFQPFLWYLFTDVMSTPDAVAKAFGSSTWPWYIVASVEFYTVVFLLLPMALKAVGLSAYLSRSWPMCLGLMLDMLVFLACIIAITCANSVVYELLFFSELVLDFPPWLAQAMQPPTRA